MKMRELLEKQDNIVTAIKGILDKPEGKSGDLSDKQEQRASELQNELAKVKNLIKLQADVDETEQRMAGNTVSNKDFETECRAFSLHKAIKHMISPKSVDAGREIEVSQEMQRIEGRSSEGFLVPYSAIFESRDAGPITTTTPDGHAGANLVANDFRPDQYVDLLRVQDPLAGLGIRRLSGLHGNLVIPKQNSGLAVGWCAENASIPTTDMGFDVISLSPKHCGAIAHYSRQMMLQASPDIEGLIKSDLSKAMSLKIAEAVIKGTGTNNEPKGIMSYNGIQKVEYTAGTTDIMTYVPEIMDKLLTSHVNNISIIVRNGFKKSVDNLLTSDGLPVGDAAFFRNVNHSYVDNSFIASDNIMIAGDFSQVILGTWGGVEVLVNPFSDAVYGTGNVAVRILLSVDVALRHEEAFATLEPGV